MALRSVKLSYVALHYITLHCIALQLTIASRTDDDNTVTAGEHRAVPSLI